jgi:hypothetical protein
MSYTRQIGSRGTPVKREPIPDTSWIDGQGAISSYSPMFDVRFTPESGHLGAAQ